MGLSKRAEAGSRCPLARRRFTQIGGRRAARGRTRGEQGRMEAAAGECAWPRGVAGRRAPAWQHRRKERQREKPGGGKPPRPSGWSPDVGHGCKDDERLYHRQGHRGPGHQPRGPLGEARAAWGHCCPPPAGEQGLTGWVHPRKHSQRLWKREWMTDTRTVVGLSLRARPSARVIF